MLENLVVDQVQETKKLKVSIKKNIQKANIMKNIVQKNRKWQRI